MARPPWWSGDIYRSCHAEFTHSLMEFAESARAFLAIHAIVQKFTRLTPNKQKAAA
jgi:hypothetical protein